MTTAARLDSYAAARDWLYSLKNRGSKYGIDRMVRLAEALGHPERSYPCIHVAGTNGKGSTCAMLERVLRGHGWRVGLSTSPHLVRQGERIQVDRRILEDEEILGYVRELLPTAEAIGREDPELHPSFFEFMTAMAFLHFERSKVDVAVIEVGLGGRLDATNVVQPELCVITSIGLDHCEILGGTHAAIAREKGGIIKAGVPVVIGRLPPEADAEIAGICAERGSPLHRLTERFGEDLESLPATNLKGSYQRLNAGVALLASELLRDRFRLDMERTRRCLLDVAWAGRWEERRMTRRQVVFDVSHNEEGARWLEDNLARLQLETGGAKPDVVMGVMGGYRAASLVPTVARWARSITFVVPSQDRACSWEELEGFVPKGFEGMIGRSSIAELFPEKGVCTLDFESDSPLVITGSIYLIGEIWDRYYLESPLGHGALQDF